MSKTLSDFFSIPLNTSSKRREMNQGLRDQLLPEKISDIFGRVFTSIDDKPLVDTSQSQLAVVIRVLTTNGPPVGSMPWVKNIDPTSPQSSSKISNFYYVASYDRVNLFNKLPENIGESRTKLDQMLEKDLILAYIENSTINAQGIVAGTVVQIEFVNWPKEARIIAVQEKNTISPANNDIGAKTAFGNGDGSTVGELLGQRRMYGIPRETLCKGIQDTIKLANEIGIQDPRVLAAFRAVESSGNPTAIRFEPHLFNRKSKTKVPFTKSKNPKITYSQEPSETNKQAFDRAYAINPKLAIESTSFGSYQVVTMNVPTIWSDPQINNDPNKFLQIFYGNPQEFSKVLVKSWFNNNPGAVLAANTGDFERLVGMYNGSSYKEGRYDIKFKEAYEAVKSKCIEYNDPTAGVSFSSFVEGLEDQGASQQEAQQNNLPLAFRPNSRE